MNLIATPTDRQLTVWKQLGERFGHGEVQNRPRPLRLEPEEFDVTSPPRVGTDADLALQDLTESMVVAMHSAAAVSLALVAWNGTHSSAERSAARMPPIRRHACPDRTTTIRASLTERPEGIGRYFVKPLARSTSITSTES